MSAAPRAGASGCGGGESGELLIAIDAAWSQPDKAYLHHSIQNRNLDTSRGRQVKGALRTLEGHDDQSLVEVPLKPNGRHRDYARFRLMTESGRGGTLTPEYYTVPSAGEPTITSAKSHTH